MATIYDYTVKNRVGEPVSLKDYEGKVLLIVNTATGCGFTPQYEGLEALYRKYKDQGFEVLDFPCNQFGHQAPGTDDEIHSFCTAKYDTTFPRFAKVDVNGENADPLFLYLESQKGFAGFGIGPAALAMAAMLKAQDKNYKENPSVKWNFTKFLVDRNGSVVERFEPTVAPEKIDAKVAALL